MKIRRDVLERIVLEEFVRFLKENGLNEAPLTTPDDEEDIPRDLDSGQPIPTPENAPEEPTGMPEVGAEVEEPGAEDPADDDLAAQEAGEEPEDEQGSVAQQLEGKSVASITMDDESKMMPGAKEVVVTFNEIEDALRILITDTGQVKFFFRGLHNDLNTVGKEGNTDEPTQAPDDIEDVPDGDSMVAVDTPNPPEDDEEEEEIEI